MNQIQCAECGRETKPGTACSGCGAPLTLLPVLPDDDAATTRPQYAASIAAQGSPETQVFALIAIAIGVAMFGFCAFADEQVVHGFLTQASPQTGGDYQTSGALAINLTVWSLLGACGLIAASWGLRRLRRVRGH